MSYGQKCRDLIAGTVTIKGNQILDSSGAIKTPSVTTKKIDLTGQVIEFTNTINKNYCPCVIHNYKASANIAPYRILKVGDEDFTVKEMESDDPNEKGIIGISTTSAMANGIVKVCTAGIFSIQIESGTSVTRGDEIRKSATEDGTARPIFGDGDVGTFGIALESADSATPGPVIKVAFIKNENY